MCKGVAEAETVHIVQAVCPDQSDSDVMQDQSYLKQKCNR